MGRPGLCFQCMSRPKHLHNSVQRNELPVLYQGVYLSIFGKVCAFSILATMVLSPFANVAAAETATTSDKTAAVNIDPTPVKANDAAEVTAPNTNSANDTQENLSAKKITDTSDNESASTEAGSDTDIETINVVATATNTTVTSAASLEASKSSTTPSEEATSTTTAVSNTNDAVLTADQSPVVLGTTKGSSNHPVIATTSQTNGEAIASSSNVSSPSSSSPVATNASTSADSNTDDDVAAPSNTGSNSEDLSSSTATDEEASTAATENTTSNPSDEQSQVQGQATTTSKSTNNEKASKEPATTNDLMVTTIEYTNTDNRYQFAESECVAVADGSYYCHASDQTDTTRTDAVVMSQVDSSGYANLYMQNGNDTKQLTNAQYDDKAPHYDPDSETVVWHRSIDDVFQIFALDLTTNEEQQLTYGVANSMQPVRSGSITVWQSWSDNAWQIMLQTENKTPQQITTGAASNVAPYINGNYVMWNVVTPDQPQQVALYDTVTGVTSYIDDTDGGQVTNPRFVLMYDTKFANGDTVTKGYDPETGRVVPLSAQPAPRAPDIPDSDPVGETRALIQNKNNPEDDDDMEIRTEPSPSKSSSSATSTTKVSSANPSSASSTAVVTAEDMTITIPATNVASTTNTANDTATTTTTSTTNTDNTNSAATNPTSTITPLSEYDLPIAPFGTSTESVSTTSNKI